jgi:hypothetical protein
MSSTQAFDVQPQHGALRILLRILAPLAILAGILVIFATKPLLAAVGTPPTLIAQPLVLMLFKAYGAFAVPVGYLAYVSSRDPVRYVAIIDAMILGLVILVAIEIYSEVALGLLNWWPAPLIWASIILRSLLAIVLFALRPRS